MTMFIKYVISSESGNHAKEGELAEMEQSTSRKGSSHEQDYWCGSAFIEALETFQANLIVVINGVYFGFAEDQGSQATQ